MAITMVYAPPKRGKTLYLAYLVQMLAFDNERTKLAKKEIANRCALGYPLQDFLEYNHFIYSNVEIRTKRNGYSQRLTHYFNPVKVAVPNDKFETTFFPDYSIIIWDECQKQLNSRKSLNRFTSAWFEQSGHMHYDIYLATQRPKLTDLNVRELITRFIYIDNVEFRETKKGVETVIYTIEHTDCYAVEQFVSSGYKEPKGEKYTYHFAGDLRLCYDAYCYNENYYSCFVSTDPKIKVSFETNEEYNHSNVAEYTAPKGYYD